YTRRFFWVAGTALLFFASSEKEKKKKTEHNHAINVGTVQGATIAHAHLYWFRRNGVCNGRIVYHRRAGGEVGPE
ncbi:hypothetical protein BC939DRAFT_530227, partial [Gamsiella multidivaricata]|uniref:uncharacterized protein n=1 Tax=Gamsiella multidivaricata TaxID=101098 RepID=UPI0022211FEB